MHKINSTVTVLGEEEALQWMETTDIEEWC